MRNRFDHLPCLKGDINTTISGEVFEKIKQAIYKLQEDTGLEILISDFNIKY